MPVIQLLARNFYPRPPRGGRQRLIALSGYRHRISIHALREEGDLNRSTTTSCCSGFLSTPSARRATSVRMAGGLPIGYFYPRPPRGGRQRSGAVRCPWSISIHALREEGDLTELPSPFVATHFYPRPPRGGRPTSLPNLSPDFIISIHALREEGDAAMPSATMIVCLFLSTPSARRATVFGCY